MTGVYKTRSEVYRTCAKWLGYRPDEILMVACHNFDLMAARETGYRSAFVERPSEWGLAGPQNPAHDIVVRDFGQLAQRLGA
jgi:2-haloacid dehalogenase